MTAYALNTQPARACNCIGPQNGDPLCPCQMGAYREREAGRQALKTLYRLGTFDSAIKTRAAPKREIVSPDELAIGSGLCTICGGAH